MLLTRDLELDEIIQGVTPALFQSFRVRWYKADREGMPRGQEEGPKEINQAEKMIQQGKSDHQARFPIDVSYHCLFTFSNSTLYKAYSFLLNI